MCSAGGQIVLVLRVDKIWVVLNLRAAINMTSSVAAVLQGLLINLFSSYGL